MKIASNAKTITLPEPELRDSMRLDSRVLIKEMQDGSIRTHKRTRTDIEILDLTFDLSRTKAVELLEFIVTESHKVLTVNDGAYLAVLKVNPFELEMQRRAVYCNSNDAVFVNLQLEKRL